MAITLSSLEVRQTLARSLGCSWKDRSVSFFASQLLFLELRTYIADDVLPYLDGQIAHPVSKIGIHVFCWLEKTSVKAGGGRFG